MPTSNFIIRVIVMKFYNLRSIPENITKIILKELLCVFGFFGANQVISSQVNPVRSIQTLCWLVFYKEILFQNFCLKKADVLALFK
jgi:hypothetical protein